MSEPDHQQHELGREPASADGAAGHELSDVNIRGLVTFLAGLVISLAVVVIAVAWMFVLLLQRADQSDPPQPPLADLRAKEPPAPRLQESPAFEMGDMQSEQDNALKQTKWIDEQQKVVQIPIERAMRLLVEQGLPDWPPTDMKQKSAEVQQ